MPGGIEVWVVVGVIVLLFGASAIPKLARSVGKAKKEFKEGMKEADAPDEAEASAKETSDSE
ncbi:MAG: twin-arginine translocase TatA/TatE family subunit [Lentisphaeria bacterium]|nr:twin-arginine translocase TatA/TatE family subunit [Lentisphaeria bacterium]NQZ66531.1 twin-arginine translocase TatA/TatE family subunit [Lentisphaeria bacterium]